MNLLKLPLAYLLIISVVAVPVAGQHKRRSAEKSPARPQAAPAPTPTPEPAAPVTFDTLLSANSYKIYGEIRGVGQLVRSNAATDVLDPILKLGGPPGAFTDGVNWLKVHADQLMTSRLLVAAWPTASEVPDGLIAIEFSSSDEAKKFESQLNGMLAKALAPIPEKPEKKAEKQSSNSETQTEAPAPKYYLQRADSLVLLSPQPVQLKKLKPKGSKLLAEDTNFRTAYNRFSSEPVFVYVDVASIQKESEERTKKAAEEMKKAEEARKEAETKEEEKVGVASKMELTEEEKAAELVEVTPEPSPEVPTELAVKEPSEAEVLSNAMSGVRNNLFSLVPNLPDALGIGFSPESDSFDVRLLMIDAAGEFSDPIPFFSGLRLGGPVTPESPGVLPGDSELVIMLSLDFPQIHGIVSDMEGRETVVTAENIEPASTGTPVMQQPPEFAAPLKTIERITKINVKDELLPLLGSEVSVSMPMTEFGLAGFGVIGPRMVQPTEDEKSPPRVPFIVISLRDREGMRRLMPRILEGFAGKAAAALAQTERREDTELVSIANIFAYAFVGNFLVLSPEAATTRHVVDSYLKGETLASNVQFKTYTRWQPRQVQANVFVSSAFAESYKSWGNDPNSPISDEARAFLTRVSSNPQPITYSLSNDGLGALHELHVPKSFVITAIAGIASSVNPPETVKNERQAMGTMWAIAAAQRQYKEDKKGAYGSLEELIAAEMVSKETVDTPGYKFEIRLVPDGYEVLATPVEYGKSGKRSFFMNQQSHMIRGADHGGSPASASDPEVAY
jgi:hypothetical protein